MTTSTRHRFGACIALLASAALLAACGSGTPGQSADDDAEAGDREVVEFWHHTFTTPENDWYEQVVQDFNDSQDEIFVNSTVVPGDAWDEKMTAAQAAGTAPDVYPVPGRLNDGVRLGSYLALDDLMPAEAFEQVSDAAAEISQVDGTWYGYPLLLEPQRVLYWNKDIFAEAGLDPESPPTSWDELYEACEQIQPVLSDGQFCIETFSDQDTLAWSTVAEQMHVAGHLPISEDWTTAEATDPAYEELIEHYTTLYDEGYIPRQSLAAGNSAAPFGEGEVAMITQGSWGMSELVADYPEVVESTGVAPTVTSDGNQTETLTTVGNFKWVIDANTENAEATAAFIEYVLAGDTDVLLPFFVNTQFTKAPAREDVAEAVNADPGAAEAPWSQVITEDVVPYTIGEPLYPWDVNVSMGLAIQQSMMGDVAPADALTEANSTIEQIIEREDLPTNREELGD